jgi:hypothetical protein
VNQFPHLTPPRLDGYECISIFNNHIAINNNHIAINNNHIFDSVTRPIAPPM